MQQGNYANLILTASGQLIAFATGADACAEHEGGSRRLMSTLCNQYANEGIIVSSLKKGDIVTCPDLLESKRIVKTPPQLRFIEKSGETPEAILYLADYEVDFNYRHLHFSDFESKYRDPNVAGAWDDKNFAIKVRGDAYVNALREFNEAIKEGKVVFAGSFFKRDTENGIGQLSGVIMANSSYFTEEDKAAIARAQVEYESDLRLKARDDCKSVQDKMRELSGQQNSPGYIWIRWKDQAETDVVYCLNPGYRVNADYWGPYTRQQLLDWAGKKYSYRLSPMRLAA